MNSYRRRLFRTDFIVTIAIVATMTILQLFHSGGPSLFGKSVTGLAAGVIQFYPEIAFGEVFKVHLFVFILCFAAVFYYRGVGRLLAVRGKAKAALFLSPLVGWVLITFAAVIEYPALFESVMGREWPKRIFQLSHIVSPMGLQIAALLLGAFPVFALIAKRLRAGGVGPFYKFVAVTAVFLLMRGSADPASVKSPEQGAPGEDFPDILLIGIDSLRSDRMENAGILPSLSRLRSDPSAVYFENHMVGIPRTFPSWIEILQGRYSAKTGIRHMFPGFAQREGKFTGLVTGLKNRGYQTAVISDFAGDIFPRFDAGFDEILAPSMTLGNMIRQSVDLMFPLFLPLTTSSLGRPFFPGLKTTANYSDPRHLAEIAKKRIRPSGQNNPERPHFTTIFFSTAHFPYAAPYPYYRMFADPGYRGPFYFQKNPALNGDESQITDADMRQVNNLYDGALRGVDDAIGTVFEQIKRSGKWDRTMVVITADHGEDLFDGSEKLQGHGEHLRGENVLKVPLLIKLPSSSLAVSGGALQSAGKRAAFVTRSIDIAPTLLGLVGVKEKEFDGRDLSEWIRSGEKEPEETTAYSETEIWFSRTGNGGYQKQRLDYPGISGLLTFDAGYSGEVILNPKYENIMVTSRHRALISSQWKLIYIPTSEGIKWELYDRHSDPQSLKNVFEDRSDVASSMQQSLLSKISELERSSRLVGGYVIPR